MTVALCYTLTLLKEVDVFYQPFPVATRALLWLLSVKGQDMDRLHIYYQANEQYEPLEVKM